MVPPHPPPASAGPIRNRSVTTRSSGPPASAAKGSPTRRKPAALRLPSNEQLPIRGDRPGAGEQQHERGAEEQEVKVEWPVAAGAVMNARNHNEAAQKASEHQP